MTSSASEELTSCDFCWEPLYFPLHSQCLLIAKRVIQNRCNKSVELGVDSLDRLYEVLEGRYNAREELEGHKAPFCWLPEPNDYLGVGDDFEPLAYEQEKVQVRSHNSTGEDLQCRAKRTRSISNLQSRYRHCESTSRHASNHFPM